VKTSDTFDLQLSTFDYFFENSTYESTFIGS